jgi:hypothetical protein
VKKGAATEPSSVAFVGYLDQGILERVGPVELLFSLQETICLGDSLQFRGSWYKETGTYLDTASNPIGIDSIFKLQLATEICLSTQNGLPTDSYKIYPNPATQVLFVRSTEGKSFDLQIYGISGNLVFQRSDRNEYELDVQDYQPGLYILKLSRAGLHCIHKVLIE